MDITVVLPTRNESKNIERFLKSIPATIPLIVVDSSNDETTALIYEHHPHHTTIVQQQLTVTQARQLGAQLVHTKWMLFTDADITFAPDYFDTLIHHIQKHPECQMFIGPKLTQHAYRAYYASFFYAQRFFTQHGIPAASGSNLVVSTHAFNTVEGFDDRLTCNEDSEFAWRVARAGFNFRFADDLKVYAHDHRRLQGRVLHKMLHSSLRCTLLYLNLIPTRLLSNDWGYWHWNKPVIYENRFHH